MVNRRSALLGSDSRGQKCSGQERHLQPRAIQPTPQPSQPHNPDNHSTSAQRVGFFNIGSGRVEDKIPGSGSGSGRVGVSKYMIGYFRVSFLLSGISGYVGYFRVCRVFSGMSGIFGYVGYFRIFLGLPIYTRVIF